MLFTMGAEAGSEGRLGGHTAVLSAAMIQRLRMAKNAMKSVSMVMDGVASHRWTERDALSITPSPVDGPLTRRSNISIPGQNLMLMTR